MCDFGGWGVGCRRFYNTLQAQPTKAEQAPGRGNLTPHTHLQMLAATSLVAFIIPTLPALQLPAMAPTNQTPSLFSYRTRHSMRTRQKEGSGHKRETADTRGRQRAFRTLQSEPPGMPHSPSPCDYSHLPCYSFTFPHIPTIANRAPRRSLNRFHTKVQLTTPKRQWVFHTNPERKVTYFLNRTSFYFQILGIFQNKLTASLLQ